MGHIEFTAGGTLELSESIPTANPPDIRFTFTARSMLAVAELPAEGEAGILYLRTGDNTLWFYAAEWHELGGGSELWLDDGDNLRPLTDGRGLLLRDSSGETVLITQGSMVFFGPVSADSPYFYKQGWPSALGLGGSLEITFPVNVYRTALKHHSTTPNSTDPSLPRTDWEEQNSYNDGQVHQMPAGTPPLHSSRWFMNVMGSGTKVTLERGNWQSEIELYAGLGSKITRPPTPARGAAHFSAQVQSFLNGQQIALQPAWDVEAFGITRNNFCTMLAPVTIGAYDSALQIWQPDTWRFAFPNNASSPDSFNATVASGHAGQLIQQRLPGQTNRYWVYAQPTVHPSFMSTLATGGYLSYTVIDAATGASPVGLPACFNNMQTLLAAFFGAVWAAEFAWVGMVEVLVRRNYTPAAAVMPNPAWPHAQ
jgi:hypothetical protein